MHEAGLASLCCVVGRSEAVLGPLALPRRSPCWNCARLRLSANAAWRTPETGSIDADSLARRLAAEALAATRARAEDVGGYALILEGKALRSSRHLLLGVPGCSICGGPSRASAGTVDSATELAARALQLLVDDRVGIIHRIFVEPADEDHPTPPVIATAVPADAPIEAAERRPMPAGWGQGLSAEVAAL